MPKKIKIILDFDDYTSMLADLEMLKRKFEPHEIHISWIESILELLESNREVI